AYYKWRMVTLNTLGKIQQETGAWLPQGQESENASSEEVGGGDYVSLYSPGQTSEELAPSRGEPLSGKDGNPRDPLINSASGKDSRENGERSPKSLDALESGQSEEEVDELTLIDHNEIMARLTLKQEGDDGPDVRGGSGDILLVHATETDRKDLVLYCEAFLTTYRTFISPEELIKKLQYRYPSRVCSLQSVRPFLLALHHF
ncbi:hypothetical protein U0070_000632, partial [Myodes glareolus]